MSKITYFIGAGASYHSLPLIKTMGKRMKAFNTYLKINRKDYSPEIIDKFINELDKLIEIEQNSTSIDAYAKELTNSGKYLELQRLKIILSSYLIFEQLIKPKDLSFHKHENIQEELPKDVQEMILNPIDKRYRTFWADYIDGPNSKPPSKIKVLSWNYDMQFEVSFSNFKNYNLEATQNEIQIYPSKTNIIDKSKFCILKLNGTAGLYRVDKNKLENLFDLSQHHLNKSNINILIDYFHENYRRAHYEPIFSFAWENNSITNETRKIAKEIIQETNILVIIGYSFPSFNREIDRKLFENIENLEKIYFQAPEEELDILIDRLNGINPKLNKLVHGIKDLSSFHVPYEFK